MPKDLKTIIINREIAEEIGERKDTLRIYESWRMTVEEWIREQRPHAPQKEITEEVDVIFERLAQVEMDQNRKIREEQEMKLNSTCVGDISYFEVLQRPNV